MALFSNKNNRFIAAQDLKIVQDCVRIINTTKKPNIFFERYKLMEEKLQNLVRLHGVHYSGTSPKKMLSQVKHKKQAAIHDMIERYFSDISVKIAEKQTEKAKQHQRRVFKSVLELYYSEMDDENINYIHKLYETLK